MSTVTTTTPDDSPADDGRRTLVRWLRPDGAAVRADEPVCDVRADDGTSAEATSPEGGTLRHLVGEGATFTVGDEVYRIEPTAHAAVR